MRRRRAAAALLCERRQAPAGDRRSDERDTPASGASKSDTPASGASKSNAVSQRATTGSASRGAARAANYLRSHWLRPEKSLLRETFLSWPGTKVDPVQTGVWSSPSVLGWRRHGRTRLLAAGGLPPRGRGGGRASGLGSADPPQLRGSAWSVREEGFGRSVAFEGSYDPALQLLVPARMETGQFRVLTGLRRADGSVVAVVRGVVSEPNRSTAVQRPGPAGRRTAADGRTPGGGQSPERSDRVRTLAGSGAAMAGSLIDGFVTSLERGCRKPGPDTGSVAVPRGPEVGSAMAAYVGQWWLFAAFTLFMAFRMARDIGMREAEVAEITPERPAEPT